MIKGIDTEATCSVVWTNDPAVDRENSDVEAYAKNPYAGWRETIKIRNGEKPTEFVIGVVPPGELIRIEAEARTGTMLDVQKIAWGCFLYGLRDIKDGPVIEVTDRTTGKRKTEVPKVTVNGIQYVDPEWLSKVFGRYLRIAATTIGMIIYRFNELSEEDSKN